VGIWVRQKRCPRGYPSWLPVRSRPPRHGPPVGPGAPARARPPGAAPQRSALVRAWGAGAAGWARAAGGAARLTRPGPLRLLTAAPSSPPGCRDSVPRTLRSWRPGPASRGPLTLRGPRPLPQRAELRSGHRLVLGASFPAADPAHLHVGERHGLHHGRGAVCGRRSRPGLCPGLRCPPQEVGVSGRTVVIRKEGWPGPGGSAQRLSLCRQGSASGLAGAYDAVSGAGGVHAEFLPETALSR
jgi:hypothetical protein